MRRYRYGDPKSAKARNRVISQVLKFFVGWNLLGYCVWKYMKSTVSEKHPEFEDKSNSEQVRFIMTGEQTNVKKYRVKIGGDNWFSVKKVEDEPAPENSNTSSEASKSENLNPSVFGAIVYYIIKRY